MPALKVAVPLLGLFVSLGLPSGLCAQGQGAPVNEPLGNPAVEPELPRDVAETSEPRFSYFVTAQEGWSRNISLTPEAEDDTANTDRLGAGARYAFRAERSDVTLSGDASWVNYRRTDVSGLGRWTFGGGIDGSYRLSPRSTFTFSENYAYSSFEPAEILQTTGLPVSAVQSRRNRASAGLRAEVGPRSVLSLQVRQASITFDEGEVAQEFVDTNVLTFAPSFSRRLGADDSLTLSYSYQRRLKPDFAPDFQLANLGWTGRLSRRVVGGVTAGVTRVAATTVSPVLWEPNGSARLSMELRKGQIALGVARVVNQAFGFGSSRRLDRAYIDGTRYIGRRFVASATGAYGRSRTLGTDARVDVDTWSAGGRLGYAASRHLDVAVAYNHAYTNPLGPVPGYRFERATVSLTYGSARQ